MRWILFALVAATLAACATPPADHEVTKGRAYNQSYEQVWEGLVRFFASRNIAVKNIAKDSGVIFAERASFADELADCGSRGMWQVLGRRVGFNVFVTKSGERPFVSVNTEFVEVRKFYEQVVNVTCVSTGVLEAQVLSSLGS